MAKHPRLEDLTLILKDEWGELFYDPDGYLWRPWSFEPRYAVLHQADRVRSGGWEIRAAPLGAPGNWFRSWKPSPNYAPSSLEQFTEKTMKPGPATSEILKLGMYAIGAYIAVQFLPIIAERLKRPTVK